MYYFPAKYAWNDVKLLNGKKSCEPQLRDIRFFINPSGSIVYFGIEAALSNSVQKVPYLTLFE